MLYIIYNIYDIIYILKTPTFKSRLKTPTGKTFFRARRLKTPTIKSNPINLALHKIALAELFQVALDSFTRLNTSCMLR